MDRRALLSVGDPAPWFVQRGSGTQGDYHFDKAAGRYSLLFFFRSSTEPSVATALASVHARGALFDSRNALFFGITNDPADEQRLTDRVSGPGVHFFWDTPPNISALYGFSADRSPFWMIIDPMLRVTAVIAHHDGVAEMVLDLVARIPPAAERIETCSAPVLLLSDVFEPDFCEILMEYYRVKGNHPSGVYTEHTPGRSRPVIDSNFKRRRDCNLESPDIVDAVQRRITRRIVPEIQRSYQFNATRLERLVVACYDAAEGGRFGAHRDNTITAAQHRRFAVSINLNDGFSGGGVTFPEFGVRSFAPPAGGALVFSCGLMHRVEPVTQGMRFACLTFLYDEAAAEIRRKNWEKAKSERRE